MPEPTTYREAGEQLPPEGWRPHDWGVAYRTPQSRVRVLGEQHDDLLPRCDTVDTEMATRRFASDLVDALEPELAPADMAAVMLELSRRLKRWGQDAGQMPWVFDQCDALVDEVARPISTTPA